MFVKHNYNVFVKIECCFLGWLLEIVLKFDIDFNYSR